MDVSQFLSLFQYYKKLSWRTHFPFFPDIINDLCFDVIALINIFLQDVLSYDVAYECVFIYRSWIYIMLILIN